MPAATTPRANPEHPRGGGDQTDAGDEEAHADQEDNGPRHWSGGDVAEVIVDLKVLIRHVRHPVGVRVSCHGRVSTSPSGFPGAAFAGHPNVSPRCRGRCDSCTPGRFVPSASAGTGTAGAHGGVPGTAGSAPSAMNRLKVAATHRAVAVLRRPAKPRVVASCTLDTRTDPGGTPPGQFLALSF